MASTPFPDVMTPESDDTVAEALLGKETFKMKFLAPIMAWPVEYRASAVAFAFASLVLLPFLGAVGLWDCWEVHYGEVARQMIQRNDYVHPWWENAWFFSKPAFTMWMMSFGMQMARGGAALALGLGVAFLVLGGALFMGKLPKVLAAGPTSQFWGFIFGWVGGFLAVLGLLGSQVHLAWKFADIPGGDGALPLFTEWGFRLPFTGFAIVGVTLLTYAMSRTVSARAGLATAFVMVTSPVFFLIMRQAVTDTPIVAATISGFACVLVALLDTESKHRAAWWYGAYVFFAIATLAKGLLGFGIPMVVFLMLLIFSAFNYRWSELTDHIKWVGKHALMPLVSSVVLGLIVGAIAYNIGASRQTLFMSTPTFTDKIDTSLSAPAWLAIVWWSLTFWAAMTVQMGRILPKLTEKPPTLWAMLYEMRAGTGILLFLAVCLPWYYEMFTFKPVDDESKIFWFRFIVHDHFARLGSGVHTTTPGGDFTYFIEQGGYGMFPWVVLIPGAMATVSRFKLRGGTSADVVGVVAVLWFSVTWALIGSSATKFHHYVFPMIPPMAMLMGLFIDKLWSEGLRKHSVALIFGVPLLILVSKDMSSTPKNFTDLFVYNYDRPYPEFLTTVPVLGSNNIKQLMSLGSTLVVAIGGLFLILRSKTGVFGTFMAGVLVFALWFNWSHWVDLSHNWTQRDQFWRYYTQRKGEEPIAAFLMNWRGETFYSRNQVKQIKDNANEGMRVYANQPGRKWSLVEHNRLGILQQAVGPNHRVTLIDKDLNNKFVLVTIE